MIISKEFRFESSHVLSGHSLCSGLHGHSYRLKVEMYYWNPKGKEEPIATLESIVRPLVNLLNYSHLNWHINYPTSENVAIYVAWHIKSQLPIAQFSVTVQAAGMSTTWDSSDQFDAERLSDGYDAGWRRPEIAACNNVPEELEELSRVAPVVLEEALDKNMRYVQLKAYAESLGKPGAIFSELKSAVK